MSTSTLTEPATADTQTAEIGTTHLVCCEDDNLALCGTDATELEWDAEAEVDCVVCDDLEKRMEATDSCAGICPKRCRAELPRGGDRL